VAPEVALGQPYDERCDVYSLALIIWEILNVETPFDHSTVKDLKRSVWDDATCRRPEILLVAPSVTPTGHDENQVSSFLAYPKSGWTTTLKALTERSWAHNLSERPTMEELESELNIEVARCLKLVDKLNCGGARDLLSSTRLTHDTRRSTFVYESGAAVVDSKLKRFGFSCVE
jgi:serine/threonine protein kinase